MSYRIFENNCNKDIKIWCDNIEEGAMTQINNMLQHPTIDKISIMPDCHEGYGVCIGSIILSHDSILPNAVGVDVGCGMRAFKTNIKIDEVDNLSDKLQKCVDLIKNRIPVGFKHRDKILNIRPFEIRGDVCVNEIITNSAFNQIGTLGGGNHFIEIQNDEDNMLWVMIHSGSRNLGKKVCDYYNNEAKENCLKYKQNKIVKDDLAFIPIDTQLMYNYIDEMNTCISFAKENRYQMSNIIYNIISEVFDNAEKIEDIETLHNFCRLENHFGKNYWVHRKGAICAKGKVIIPGSQGTASYICDGLENKLSYCSASHGSGRKMSRALAKKTLDLETVQKNMGNIIHNITSVEQLDEAAEAYKDIEDVINAESDLVTPIYKLTPLAVIKG